MRSIMRFFTVMHYNMSLLKYQSGFELQLEPLQNYFGGFELKLKLKYEKILMYGAFLNRYSTRIDNVWTVTFEIETHFLSNSVEMFGL
jgi:hypothetical protein